MARSGPMVDGCRAPVVSSGQRRDVDFRPDEVLLQRIVNGRARPGRQASIEPDGQEIDHLSTAAAGPESVS